MRELVAVSNLRHCKDNDKAEAGLRGAPLSTFVNKNFTPLSNEFCRNIMKRCKFCRLINQGSRNENDSLCFSFLSR